MGRRALGLVLLLLGAVLVVAGLVVMFVVVPGMKQFPDDVDTIRHYQGTVPVQLNPATFEFMRDLNVDLERHFMTVETDGDLALVREEQTLSTQGQPLQQILKHHAIDRKSMEAVSDYPEAWNSNANLFAREGLSLGWPIDSEKKDYVGWSDDYRKPITLKFEGEVEHPVAGIDTYYYTSASDGPQPIDPAAVAVMGLPTELSQEQLTGLVGGLNPALAPILPTLMASAEWPDPIPLIYVYDYTGEYWIEPTTGVLIDTHKVEIRSVTMPDELLQALAARIDAIPGADPAMIGGLLPLTVSHLEYRGTDESVLEAKDDAEDAKNQIQLFGTTLPIGAIVIGLVLALAGIFLARRA